MAILWSRESDRDLWSIFDFGATEYGRDRADSYLRGLYDTVETLLTNPAMGSIRLTNPPTRIIFYRIVDEDILVVRVLHGRADWAATLDLQ